MTVKWDPPKDSGGRKIDYYKVEMKDVTMNGDWTVYDQKVGADWVGLPNENQCTVEHGIKHDHVYQFRVCAVNEMGDSEWVETQPEKAEDKFS